MTRLMVSWLIGERKGVSGSTALGGGCNQLCPFYVCVLADCMIRGEGYERETPEAVLYSIGASSNSGGRW